MIYRSPVPAWEGLTMAEVFDRYRAWRRGVRGSDSDSPDETTAFAAIGGDVRDDGEFFLMLLRPSIVTSTGTTSLPTGIRR